jgi:hypothetical protein
LEGSEDEGGYASEALRLQYLVLDGQVWIRGDMEVSVLGSVDEVGYGCEGLQVLDIEFDLQVRVGGVRDNVGHATGRVLGSRYDADYASEGVDR